MRTRENIMKIIFAAAVLACATGAIAAEGVTTRPLPKNSDAGTAVEVTRFDPERCALTMESKDKTLVLRAETKPTGSKSCEASFKISAPRAGSDSDAGDIVLDAVRGDARAGAGFIDIGDKWSR